MSKSCFKDGDAAGRKFCILTAIKPSNVEREKMKFFKSDFIYNPQFEYASGALSSVLAKHSQASSTFLKQVTMLLWHPLLMHLSLLWPMPFFLASYIIIFLIS